MDQSKIQKDYEIEVAKRRLSSAELEMNGVQKEFKKEFVISSEKIALFSAGIISVSLTAVGYFLSARVNLADKFLLLPIYLFLYCGWCLLFFSFALGMIARRQNSIHFFYAVELEWRNSLRKLNNLNGHKSDKITLRNLAKTKKSERNFFKDVDLLQNILPIIFIFGVAAMMLFAVGCVDQLVKH